VSNIKPKVEIILGDITKQDTDAILNAENKALATGGGVPETDTLEKNKKPTG